MASPALTKGVIGRSRTHLIDGFLCKTAGGKNLNAGSATALTRENPQGTSLAPDDITSTTCHEFCPAVP